ncbi:MAG: phage terminase large subunit, partial [Robiginitomaculum sp.]|nr:phage terminase large subunit [Robiginitomaculum sp.]
VDVVRERVEFDDLVTLINSTAKRWDANQIIVEDKGSGTQYIQTQGGGSGVARKAPCPVVAISTDNKSKEFRFDGVTIMFKVGEVVLPRSAIWLAEYESELLSFPTCKHDDQVDSTSQYLAKANLSQTKRGTVKAIVGGSGRPNSPAIDVVSERPPPSAKIGGTRTTPPEPVVETPSTPPKKHPKANRATRLHDSSIRRRLGR